MGYPQSPPDPPPHCEENCPNCGASDEEIEYSHDEDDSDEIGIGYTLYYKCGVCGETFICQPPRRMRFS